MEGRAYRCEAASLVGFVQQIATSFFNRGYVFFVTGQIPDGKDPAAVDAKLVARYGIARSKWDAARRKRAGWANLQYLRLGRFFVLLATHGTHAFFDEERGRIRDARNVALKIGGYQLSIRNGHARVCIGRERYREVKSYFLEVATKRSAAELAAALHCLPFEPYAPIRRQLLCIWRAVNRARGEAGLAPVEKSCLRFKRRIVRPFERPDVATVAPEAAAPAKEAA